MLEKECESCKEICKNIKRYDIGEMLTENIRLKQNQTQLAIQELEKVKKFVDDRTFCDNCIEQRIKELKLKR